ncbi:Ig-like domain repeat protein [Treponema pectinovorum]|uniref:Ig-like domain repeat protein n=1 Tax=Treponema pectinovorum TaxID=164 RepID=UPI003D9356FF
MKKFSSFFGGLTFLIFALMTFSCEVGLGSTIDINPPKVEISSPKDSAVIRGAFALFGTWTDDGQLGRVEVLLRSTSDSSLTYSFTGEFTGNSTVEQKTWACKIDPLDSTKPIKDGEYKATVSVFDKAGRETKVTKTFTVDNTPPVIVLQRPGTRFDDANADSYGQTFTLEGQGADSSNIDHIDIRIYDDQNCINHLKTVTLNNVPLNIKLDVATFGSDAYTAIYGSTEKNGEKKLYCKIDAYDSAQKYPDEIGKNQNAEDTIGNKTSIYYLYDNLQDILSKYNIARLYEMMNGTFKLSESDRQLHSDSAEEIMANVKAALSNRTIGVGSFSLNPENNPKFSVNGKDALRSENLNIADENQGYRITNGSDVTIEVTPGLDGTSVLDTTAKPLKVYVIECNAQGNILSGAKKIYPNVVKAAQKSGSTHKLFINLNIENSTPTDPSYTLRVGGMYRFGVEGEDANGNEIIASASTGYGFYLESSGRAPELKITSPTDVTSYLKAGQGFDIAGYTTASEGLPTVKIFVGDSTTPVWQKTFTSAEGTTENGKQKYTFTATVPSTAFDQSNEKDYSIDISASIGDKAATVTKTVFYDLHEPEIDFTNISPLIENYEFANVADKTAANDNINGDGTFKRPFINGKIRFRGMVQDSLTKIKTVKWIVIQDDNTIVGLGGTIGTNFNFEFDTSDARIQDNKNITISFIAEDSAGNEKKTNLNYFVCQNTDKPTAESNIPNAWTAEAQQPKQIKDGTFGVHTNKLSAGSAIYAKVKDDDGIKQVEFNVQKLTYDLNYENSQVDPDQSSVPTDVKTEILTNLGSPVETIVSHAMPSFSGYFKVTITVKDLNDVPSSQSFVIQMTGLAPDVTVTNKTDYININKGEKVKLEVKMAGEAPFTIVILQNDGTPNWHESSPIIENGNIKLIDVTPITSPLDRKIKVKVTDNSSGVTTKEVDYNVDNTVPESPLIESPAVGAIGNNSITGASFIFSGKANDASAPSGETSSGIKKLYYAFMTTDTTPTTWNSQTASNGTWNINATLQTGTGTPSGTTLYEGKYWLYVKSEDGAGNQSSFVKREFTVDQAAPAITEVKLDGTHALTAGTVKYFNTASGNFTISGKVNDSNGTPTLTVNGNSVTPGAPDINGDRSWSHTINRVENSLVNISVVATDNAGRTTTLTYSIFCDTKKPVLEITNPDTDLTGETSLSSSKYTFRGSVNDFGSGVDTFKYMISQTELTSDTAIESSAQTGTDWQTVAGSSFGIEKDLIEGTTAQTGKIHEGKWHLYLYAKDRTGATSVKKRIFWVDKKSPTLTLQDIPSTTNQNIVVKGTTSDANGISNVSVKVTPKPNTWATDTETLDATTFFSTGKTLTVGSTNNLPDGTYTIEVTATDNAGKTATQTRTVLVDTLAPNGIVSIDSSNPPIQISGNDWVKKDSLKIKFVQQVPDLGSEIEEVKAKFIEDGGTDYSGLQDLTRKTSGGNVWWEGTLTTIGQGKNRIHLVVKDKAGNERTKDAAQNIFVYVDTEVPDDCIVYNYVNDSTNYSAETEITGSVTINGKFDKTFVVKAQDNDNSGTGTYSGMKTVYYKYGTNDFDKITATVLSVSDNTFKITIPANNASTTYQKTGTVKFSLEDKVGNVSQSATFSFVLDDSAPTVHVNPVTDAWTQENGDTTSNIDVNGILNLSGTAIDGYKVQSVSLKYFVGTAEPANWDSITTTSTVNGTTSWTSSIDTTVSGMDNTKNLYIKAFAQDEAGNVGSSSTMTLYINQDSDRPVITFSNLDLSETTVWLKGIKNAYGSIFDDDGITSLEFKNGSGGTYQNIAVTNGSWNQDMQDGQNEIYFRVKDSKNKVFETSTLVQPKLKSIKAGVSTITDGILTIKVDTTSPRYTNLEFASKKTDGTTSPHTTTITDLTFGGDYAKLLAKLKASDENGVASVELRLGSQTYAATIEGADSSIQNANKNDSNPHEWDFGEIAIPNFLTGPTTMRLVITDQAGTTREDNINFEIDNTKPVLSFTSHSDGATVFATADVTVRGSVDSNDLTEWYYALTNTTAQPPVGNATYKPLANASTSFTLVFDDGASTTTETHTQRLFKQICTLEGIAESVLQGNDTIRDLYIHIYGKDKAGNISDIKTLHIRAIPNGDKPTVSFSYPAAVGASLGGTIRVTGSSEIQQSEVDAVYIQIEPDPDLTWEKSANGTYYLNGSVYTKYTGSRYKLENSSYIEVLNGDYVKIGAVYSLAADTLYRVSNATFTNNWSANLATAAGSHNNQYPRVMVGSEQAIKTGGSVSSWNITLNAYDELNASKAVALKVFAVSKTGKKSDTQTIWFRMDPDAPQIGSTIPLELVQYKDDDITKPIVARRSYESNMWIKGKWYLKGSVTDDSGIKNIRLKVGNTDPVDLVTITDPVNNIGQITTDLVYKNYVKKGDQKGANFNYELNVPVGSTESDKFGVLSYEISATEGAPQSLGTKQAISLNFDNKAPQFAATTSEVLNKSTWAEKLTTELTSSNLIQNSGGTYGFYGIVNEESDATGNQSGLSRVAMYFTRARSDGNTYVIDPMRKGGATGLANFIESSANFENYTSVQNHGDGLYWLKERQFTVTGNNILTATTTNALHSSIRRGGLVKVNGAMYVINTVDTTNRQITIKGSMQNGTVKAYFAVCQVVDNFTQENGTTKAYDWSNPLLPSTNDDGDQMIEGIIESGTMATWKAFIDSKLILDGDVKLHFVAFDKAGNATEKIYDAIVKNNSPRLYGVKYGTDVNGNGTIEENEYIKTYHNKYSVLVGTITYYGYKGNLDTPVANITATERLTVKDSLRVVPRVVGGNLGLGYTYTYKSNPALTTTNTTAFSSYSGVGHYDSDTTALRPDTLGIEISQRFFIGNINDGDQAITFNLWDKTDGTVEGSTSNKAEIVIPVKVAVQDTDAPTATLKPFKWISASDNSLYANSKKNGHIELEADLPTPTFTAGGAGVYDKDPKISGIVTFEGSVKDNVVVKEIKIKIPNYNSGNEFTIATRNAAGNLDSANMLTLGGSPAKTYADYSFASKDWYFEKVKDEYADDGSNTVEFKFHFNTQKITGVAQTNVGIELTASDRGKASLSGSNIVYAANNSIPGTVQTTSTTNTGYYKVDVVPYITHIGTKIGAIKDDFSRSATGWYSVMENEILKLYGFNLVTGTGNVKLTGAVANATTGGTDPKLGNYVNVNIGSTLKSGNISIGTNGIETLNNKNANPIFVSDTDNTITNYAYNSQANNKISERYTDDVGLYVWNKGFFLNEKDITSPMLKMDSAGKYYMSYGYQISPLMVNKNGTERRVDYSYNKFHNTNVAFDGNGNLYAVATNTDRIHNDSARFVFYTPVSYDMPELATTQTREYYTNSNSKRHLEMAYNKDTGKYDINRVKRPKLATCTKGSTTYIALVYYDYNNDANPIKFRFGSKNGTSHTGSIFSSLPTATGDDDPLNTTSSGYHTIADKNSTAAKGGEYVSVGIVPVNVSTDSPHGVVAVVAWYDATAQKIMYSYNKNPMGNTQSQWQTNAKVLDTTENTGWYVDLCVDNAGGIHVAYYDSARGDLKYAYLNNYKALDSGAVTAVTVDSYQSVGTNITVNARLENGKYVPYIYYYNASAAQTKNSIKVAWRKDMTTLRDGAIDELFTDGWESMIVPTDNFPVDATVCGGVPTSGTYANKVVLGYMSDKYYEKAVLKK